MYAAPRKPTHTDKANKREISEEISLFLRVCLHANTKYPDSLIVIDNSQILYYNKTTCLRENGRSDIP